MTEGPDTPKIGRPTIFTQDLADQICEGIIDGMSLRKVLRQDGMPAGQTVWRWLRENQSFSEQYTRATAERAEAMAEDIMEISDDGTNDYIEDNYQEGKTPGYALNGENIQRSKLRVDTRKWLMSKMQPKKYGDKLDVTSGGEKLPSPIVDISRSNVTDDINEDE
jgi:hypothetical protein